jgi:hypothetical protein
VAIPPVRQMIERLKREARKTAPAV